MTLFQKLESGMLAPGWCLYGNNAYLNTSYMATPFAAISGGSKDAYNGDNAYLNTAYMATPYSANSGGFKDACNIYRLHLQIQIDRIFGMCKHQLSILWSTTPEFQ